MLRFFYAVLNKLISIDKYIFSKYNIPSGKSQRRQQAAKEPAEAPPIFSSSKCGAYFLKDTATPTWYIPRKPQPAKDKFMFT